MTNHEILLCSLYSDLAVKVNHQQPDTSSMERVKQVMKACRDQRGDSKCDPNCALRQYLQNPRGRRPAYPDIDRY